MQGRVMDSWNFGSHFLLNYATSFCLILYLYIIKWAQLTFLQTKYIPEMLHVKK